MAKSLNQEELEFVRAIEQYKKKNDKLFLSWTEVLGIVKKLGYSRPVQARAGSARCAPAPTRPARKTATAAAKKAVSGKAAPKKVAS